MSETQNGSGPDSTIRLRENDLDETLADILRAQLGCEVSLHSVDENLDLVQQAASSDQPQTMAEGDVGTIAILLPAGSVALWRTSSTDVERSARHAQALIDLEKSRESNRQMQAEVESLADQVMNDFEELALIRSLASSMELRANGNHLDDFVRGSLQALANGVGAVSIAAILTDENEQPKPNPIWTGSHVVATNELQSLIQQYDSESRSQPVVKNGLQGSGEGTIDELNEFVIVQCRSEGRLHGWIVACNRVDFDDDVPWAQLGFTTVQATLMETATNQLAAQLHNLRLLRQKEELFTEVVRALVNAVEARDPYTCGHSERVARFARCLATAIGQDEVASDRIYLTGLLHDVGKIAVPDGVLQKPGRLDDDERAVIETHTDAGWRILHELDALQDVLPGVLYHHEHYNGQGYPDGLVGENIPIDGRILAVCDAFDAMTSDRPYRQGMPVEKAAAILREGSGEYWDPVLIDAFLANIDQLNQIRVNHKPRTQATRPAPIDGVPVITTSTMVQS